MEKKSDSEINPWITIDSTLVYENKWISITHRNVITPKKVKGIYGVIHFKNVAVGILPIDNEGFTYLVGQYRYPIKKFSWEIPEGGSPLDEDPLEGGKRELLEEIGASAKTWIKLQDMDLSNSATDEKAIIFLAKDLTFSSPSHDDTEDIIVKKTEIKEYLRMVLNGEITDSISVAAGLRLLFLICRRDESIYDIPNVLNIKFDSLG